MLWFIHLYIRSSIHIPIHWYINSSIYQWSIHITVHLYIHPSILVSSWTLSCIHSSSHQSVYTIIWLFIHLPFDWYFGWTFCWIEPFQWFHFFSLSEYLLFLDWDFGWTLCLNCFLSLRFSLTWILSVDRQSGSGMTDSVRAALQTDWSVYSSVKKMQYYIYIYIYIYDAILYARCNIIYIYIYIHTY